MPLSHYVVCFDDSIRKKKKGKEKKHYVACSLYIQCDFRWTAAHGQVSLNGMILPAALYFWQIPHFMALAYLCRNDYAAGGYIYF